jgi:hypothetical protein
MEDHGLVGLWRLREMERFDLDGNKIPVEVHTGLLLYAPNGWMSEALEFTAAGTRTHVFYSGRYRIEADTVIHIPEVHLNADLIGQELPRSYEIGGDRFTLIAGNPNGSAHIYWERVLRP